MTYQGHAINMVRSGEIFKVQPSGRTDVLDLPFNDMVTKVLSLTKL